MNTLKVNNYVVFREMFSILSHKRITTMANFSKETEEANERIGGPVSAVFVKEWASRHAKNLTHVFSAVYLVVFAA